MKVLLAVSGGIDSMYMLHRAPELFPGASFAVAHCNFSLRGDESDGDEVFVRDACAALGIDCYVKRFDTLGFAAEHGVSVEMAARELRYAWFAQLCAGHGFDTLATAHNANDNAETLILNLLRGTGTKGLRGIPSGSVDAGSSSGNRIRPWLREREGPASEAKREGWSEAEVPGKTSRATTPEGVRLVRPLLETGRDEIRKWMEDKGFGWREDSTNRENEARRNKIRNQVFPVFAEINPSFIKTLGEDMARIRQTDDIAEDYYREAAERIVSPSPKTAGAMLEISVTGLLALTHWRYVLWRLLEDYGFSSETFGKLCTLLGRYSTEPQGTVTLSGKAFEAPDWILRARRKTLLLFPRPKDYSIP
ncbi:MAG: tRNA lysidine(34) synthetase TilS [Bacteroidales bacterium]|nr:tRNA lysidine(34) synthetase TilS [Bacteroidales bacterium]